MYVPKCEFQSSFTLIRWFLVIFLWFDCSNWSEPSTNTCSSCWSISTSSSNRLVVLSVHQEECLLIEVVATEPVVCVCVCLVSKEFIISWHSENTKQTEDPLITRYAPALKPINAGGAVRVLVPRWSMLIAVLMGAKALITLCCLLSVEHTVMFS